MKLRIGEGWDVHALGLGRKLMLGGIEVPHTHGLIGHSDADVLLHAVTDALLAQPPSATSAPIFRTPIRNFAARGFGRPVGRSSPPVRDAGWEIANLDCTVVAQAPKLLAYKPAMCRRIAEVLGIDPGLVNVKAKTAEKLGPVGQGQSMEARAVVLLIA